MSQLKHEANEGQIADDNQPLEVVMAVWGIFLQVSNRHNLEDFLIDDHTSAYCECNQAQVEEEYLGDRWRIWNSFEASLHRTVSQSADQYERHDAEK